MAAPIVGAGVASTQSPTVSGATRVFAVTTANSNRGLRVDLMMYWTAAAGGHPDSVKYGGVAMTRTGFVDLVSGGPLIRLSSYWLTAPTSGANNVVVDFTIVGAPDGAVWIAGTPIENVDQSNPYNTPATNVWDGSTFVSSFAVVDTHGASTCLELDCALALRGGNHPTLGAAAGQTETFNTNDGVNFALAASKKTGASSVTMTWNCSSDSGNAAFGVIAMSLNQVSAGGNVYYVASAVNGGSNANNGTAHATPKLNFVNGLALMSAGDSLYVDGTFVDEVLDFDAAGLSGTNTGAGLVTVKKYATGTAQLNHGTAIVLSNRSYINCDGISVNRTGSSNGACVKFDNTNYCTLQNGTYRDGGAGNGQILMVQTHGMCTNISVLNCDIGYPNQQGIDNGAASHGVYIEGTNGVGTPGTDLVILVQGCSIHHCDGATPDHSQPYTSPYISLTYGVQTYGGAGTNQVNGVTVDRCHIYLNSNGAVLGWGQAAASHLFINNLVERNVIRGLNLSVSSTSSGGIRIYNNTFDNNPTCIDAGPGGAVNNALVKNNIFTNCATTWMQMNAGTTVTADKNCVYNCGAATGSGLTVTNTRTSDPKYTNASAQDFTLTALSPEIGSCTTLSEAPKDYNGHTRTVSGACCGGAFEFVTVAPILNSVTPQSSDQGTTPTLTLAGVGFSTQFSGGNAVVAISGTGVSLGAPTIVSDVSITVVATIASNATVSARTITVQTDGGTSAAQTFTVTEATGGTTPPGEFDNPIYDGSRLCSRVAGPTLAGILN